MVLNIENYRGDKLIDINNNDIFTIKGFMDLKDDNLATKYFEVFLTVNNLKERLFITKEMSNIVIIDHPYHIYTEKLYNNKLLIKSLDDYVGG
jgi:hypothetical protein